MKFALTFIILLCTYNSIYSRQVTLDSALKYRNTSSYQLAVDTTDVKSFDSVYFILGTLSDSNGRSQYVNKKYQVDMYFPYEEPLVEYLTRYIENELNINVDTIFDKSGHSEMFSKQLSRKLGSFYKQKDILQTSQFKTSAQIYSFLTGVYYRYGQQLDSSIYKIQLANSPKHQNCYELLKAIGCENILYQRLKNIPTQHILYFQPTERLKRYINLIESERLILKKSFDASIGEKFSQEEWAEFSTLQNKQKTEETNRIRNAFKRN